MRYLVDIKVLYPSFGRWLSLYLLYGNVTLVCVFVQTICVVQRIEHPFELCAQHTSWVQTLIDKGASYILDGMWRSNLPSQFNQNSPKLSDHVSAVILKKRTYATSLQTREMPLSAPQ